MKVNSLAFRLFATAAVWTLLVLPVAGLIIDWAHRRDIRESFDARLSQLLTILIAFSTEQGEPEPKYPRNVGEPLFELSHSGWYWQITPLEQSPGKRMISASLATGELQLPSVNGVKPDAFSIHWLEGKGPVGEPLRIAETIFNAGEDENPRFYSFVVAGNLQFAETRIADFRFPLAVSLAVAGLGLVLSTLMQVKFGLLPLREIQKGSPLFDPATLNDSKASRLRKSSRCRRNSMRSFNPIRTSSNAREPRSETSPMR